MTAASPFTATSSSAVLAAADDVARWLVVGGGVALAVGVCIWFLVVRRHPEDAAEHDAQQGTAHETDGVARRPAGPAAENMAADPPGGFTAPGPWPGSSSVPPDASGSPDRAGRSASEGR